MSKGTPTHRRARTHPHPHPHTCLTNLTQRTYFIAPSHFACPSHTNEIFLTLLIAYPEHAAEMTSIEKGLSDEIKTVNTLTHDPNHNTPTR